MAEDLPKIEQQIEQPKITRRDFLKGAVVGTAAMAAGVAVGVGLRSATERTPWEPEEYLNTAFDHVFNGLSKEPATERPTQVGYREGYKAHEFRQGAFDYLLIQNHSGAGPERIIRTQYFHLTEPGTPSDHTIEYSIDGKRVTAHWLWKRPHGDERSDKTGLSEIEIASLATRLRADYDAWSKPINKTL